MRIQTDSDQANDKKLNIFITIAGILISVFCGVVLTIALQYGGTKSDVGTLKDDVLKLQRRSVDYIYIQDIITSNYKMIDIMKASPGTKEMEEALKAWKDFQMSTITRANPTRGGSSTSNGASQ